MNDEQWLSVKQLEARGLGSARTIWRRVSNGTFPAPEKLSPGMTRWRLSKVVLFEANPSAYVGKGTRHGHMQRNVIEAAFGNPIP